MNDLDCKGKFTDVELDQMALSGELLDLRAGGFARNQDPGPISVHYEVVTVATRGTGNTGIAFLKGITRHGKHLVWRGKVHRLVRAGCLKSVAEVATVCKFGMENAVWSLAEELVSIIEMGVNLRGVRSHAAFHVLTHIDSACSFPRIQGAIEIAYKVVEIRDRAKAESSRGRFPHRRK